MQLYMKSVLTCKCDVAIVYYFFTSVHSCKRDVRHHKCDAVNMLPKLPENCMYGFCISGISWFPSPSPVTPWDLTQSHLIRPEQT